MADTTASRSHRALHLQAISKGFDTEAAAISVLHKLDFYLEEGSIASIEGASGSGKSTLLNLIGTMDRPDTGAIFYGEQELTQMKTQAREYFRSHSLGFIFQHYHLLPDFSVLENTMMPLFLQKKSYKQAGRESMEILQEVGLQHRIHHYPSQISGGEMARASVARALVGQKSLILADEPTGNLDRKNSEQLAELLWRLQRDFRFSLIIATHDHNLAERIELRYELHSGALAQLSHK